MEPIGIGPETDPLAFGEFIELVHDHPLEAAAFLDHRVVHDDTIFDNDIFFNNDVPPYHRIDNPGVLDQYTLGDEAVLNIALQDLR